jgi:hypothetical protein
MQIEKLRVGDRITLCSESTGAEGVAIIWRATDNVGGKNNPVIRISEWLRELYSFQLNDKYLIKRSSVAFRHIESITITDITPESNSNQTAPCSLKELTYWTHTALCKCPLITAVGISDLFQPCSKLSGVVVALSKSLPDTKDKNVNGDTLE